jgi:pregnancy-associated plasma protein-A
MKKIVLPVVIAVICGMAFVAVSSADSASATAETSQQMQTDQFCGTKVDDATWTELAKTASARKRFVESAQPPRTSIVNVHFHVIQDGDIGAVDDTALAVQVDVLNDSFKLRDISFELTSVDRTSNSSWFRGCDSGQEKKIKRTLHQGTATDLNVYICEPTRFLGRGTFPWLYAKSPEEDGIILHHSILPGGSDPLFNTGEALVHETGHWLGLFHTFQGGCTGLGDEVEDTPAEAAPSFAACPIGLDTCSSLGLDPTDNFMDYSGDSCWTIFTAGQNERMASMFAVYRSGQ